jgi:uncharacterized membrane protein YedE/YeeE
MVEYATYQASRSTSGSSLLVSGNMLLLLLSEEGRTVETELESAGTDAATVFVAVFGVVAVFGGFLLLLFVPLLNAFRFRLVVLRGMLVIVFTVDCVTVVLDRGCYHAMLCIAVSVMVVGDVLISRLGKDAMQYEKNPEP